MIATAVWDFKRFVSDAVVLNLGGNDYSTEPHPEDEVYIAAFAALVRRARQAHPKAYIVCFVAEGWPGYHGKVSEAVKRSGDANAAVCTYADFKNEELGCDYHPKAWQHQVLAATLVEHLRAKLGW